MNEGLLPFAPSGQFLGDKTPISTAVFMTSTTYRVPATGTYRIWAMGAGGSGGYVNNATAGVATGGGGGGFCLSDVPLTAGVDLTITIGAGGTAVTGGSSTGSAGVAGGNTVVSGTGMTTITAGGGGAGGYAAGAGTFTVAGGAGGVASTGNLVNSPGGAGGTLTSVTTVSAYAGTGGGGAGSIFGTGGTAGGAASVSFGASASAYSGGGGLVNNGRNFDATNIISGASSLYGRGVNSTTYGTAYNGPNWQGYVGAATHDYVTGVAVAGVYAGFAKQFNGTSQLGIFTQNPFMQVFGGGGVPFVSAHTYGGNGCGGGSSAGASGYTYYAGAFGGGGGLGSASSYTYNYAGYAGRGGGGGGSASNGSNTVSGAGGDGLVVIERVL